MAMKRRVFSDEHKVKMVREFRQSGSTVYTYAKANGLAPSVLRRWVDEFSGDEFSGSTSAQQTLSSVTQGSSLTAEQRQALRAPQADSAPATHANGSITTEQAAHRGVDKEPSSARSQRPMVLSPSPSSTALSANQIALQREILRLKSESLTSSIESTLKHLVMLTSEDKLSAAQVSLEAARMQEHALSQILEQTVSQVLSIQGRLMDD